MIFYYSCADENKTNQSIKRKFVVHVNLASKCHWLKISHKSRHTWDWAPPSPSPPPPATLHIFKIKVLCLLVTWNLYFFKQINVSTVSFSCAGKSLDFSECVWDFQKLGSLGRLLFQQPASRNKHSPSTALPRRHGHLFKLKLNRMCWWVWGFRLLPEINIRLQQPYRGGMGIYAN